MLLRSTCSGLLYLCFPEGIRKQDYNRLQASASDLKKRFEDAERKLKILGKSKDAVENKLKEANIELVALKVSCDESAEREKPIQEELDKASLNSVAAG